MRYHSSYEEFERRSDQCCVVLELPSFEGDLGSVDFDSARSICEIERARLMAAEAAAKSAAEAEFRSRFKIQARFAPSGRPQPKLASLVDPQRLDAINAETLVVRGILVPILEDPVDKATASPPAERPTSVVDRVPDWAAGLPTCFVAAMAKIRTRSE